MMQTKIENFTLQPLKNPKYIKTFFATFEQNGCKRDWEIVDAHDSVAILIYHKNKNAFVLVKQFRPSIYLNNKDGMTIELCAGIVDKTCSLAQIAKEEIEEECGYSVPLENIERLSAFHTSVGFAGAKQTLYYAEVDESMQISEGGGIDDEQIEVIYLPTNEAHRFIFDESVAKTPGLMFAFMWWFEKKNHA